MNPDQLNALDSIEAERVSAAGKNAFISVYKVETAIGLLFVVQGFVSTWRFPNYFSMSRVGKVFVEGLVLENGRLERATDDLLYQYR